MASNAALKAQQLASALRLAAVGVVSVYGLSNSIFNVEGGHRAVIFNRVVGIKDTVRPDRPRDWRRQRCRPRVRQVYAEGTHLMAPWFQRPIIYDVRAQPTIVQRHAGSTDPQMWRALQPCSPTAP